MAPCGACSVVLRHWKDIIRQMRRLMKEWISFVIRISQHILSWIEDNFLPSCSFGQFQERSMDFISLSNRVTSWILHLLCELEDLECIGFLFEDRSTSIKSSLLYLVGLLRFYCSTFENLNYSSRTGKLPRKLLASNDLTKFIMTSP